MSDDLRQLLDKVHNGIATYDFDGRQVPSILIDEKKYDEILSRVQGRPLSINTDLNILQDGLGHVFVEIVLTFSQGGFKEKFLVNANTDLKFFEALAASGMLSLASPKSIYGKDSLFMIQLPKPEKAVDALEIIKTGLEKGK